jgi:hypothetical protein
MGWRLGWPPPHFFLLEDLLQDIQPLGRNLTTGFLNKESFNSILKVLTVTM